MNAWARRGLQTALLAGGFMAAGAGIAAADTNDVNAVVEGVTVTVPVDDAVVVETPLETGGGSDLAVTDGGNALATAPVDTNGDAGTTIRPADIDPAGIDTGTGEPISAPVIVRETEDSDPDPGSGLTVTVPVNSAPGQSPTGTTVTVPVGVTDATSSPDTTLAVPASAEDGADSTVSLPVDAGDLRGDGLSGTGTGTGTVSGEATADLLISGGDDTTVAQDSTLAVLLSGAGPLDGGNNGDTEGAVTGALDVTVGTEDGAASAAADLITAGGIGAGDTEGAVTGALDVTVGTEAGAASAATDLISAAGPGAGAGDGVPVSGRDDDAGQDDGRDASDGTPGTGPQGEGTSVDADGAVVVNGPTRPAGTGTLVLDADAAVDADVVAGAARSGAGTGVGTAGRSATPGGSEGASAGGDVTQGAESCAFAAASEKSPIGGMGLLGPLLGGLLVLLVVGPLQLALIRRRLVTLR